MKQVKQTKKSKKAPERMHLNPDDWIQAALDHIARESVITLSIDALARQLGVTKGSFYWHFTNRDALLIQALLAWERADAEELSQQIQTSGNPHQRLIQLFRHTSQELRSHAIYAALLQALDHPVVQPVMQKVSQRRMQYLAIAFRSAGLAGKQAMHRARLAYTTYIGFLQLMQQLHLPKMPAEEFEAYVDHVIAALIPSV